MATQADTVNASPNKVRIDPYFQTLFNDTGVPKNRGRRIYGAINGLLSVVETDRGQKNAAAAILFRAEGAGLITDDEQLKRFVHLLKPAAERQHKSKADVPPSERKGAPAEAKRRKQERSECDREFRKNHRGPGGGDGKVLRATNPKTIRKNERRQATKKK